MQKKKSAYFIVQGSTPHSGELYNRHPPREKITLGGTNSGNIRKMSTLKFEVESD